MSKMLKFILLALSIGVVALIAKPVMRTTYLLFSLIMILFGGDVYDTLESKRYQSLYPPEVVESTETMRVDGEVFVVTVEEKSIKNVFHLDPWGSSNQFVLNTTFIAKNKDDVVLEVDLPFSYFFLQDIAEDVSDINSKSSDDLVLIWKGYEFSFDFNEGSANVKAPDL